MVVKNNALVAPTGYHYPAFQTDLTPMLVVAILMMPAGL
jgi:hypothetical protein